MRRDPARPRRSDCFFGIHFDFHADGGCKDVGRTVTPSMIEEVIRRTRPDYIQCDCKGHPGISSYPTKVGHPAPGFVRDPLRIWRKVTARHGIPLFMHYSGVWDSAAIKSHPAWARIDEKGARDPNNTSVFGPYVDKLLIPQLNELAGVYGVDGVWLDGECWATCQDYHPKVLAAFREATGIRTIPKTIKDPGFFEFSEFCREGFRRYLRHYVDEVHKRNPGFQIASNWAFTTMMPEPVSANVDFISGDYTPQDSVNSARFEGRFMAAQEMPWDLMAWSFAANWGDKRWSTKSVPQLQREAATVLSLGGGFQAYFPQKRDGSVSLWQMDLMAEVAKFCRARQRVCHRARAVPQVALLVSTADFYRRNERVFTGWTGLYKPCQGILQALLEGQHSVELLAEHHLKGKLAAYPLVIIPEWMSLKPSFKRELLDHVKQGGNVLCIGPETTGLFRKQLDVTFREKPDGKDGHLHHANWTVCIKGGLRKALLGRRARAFGRIYPLNDPAGPSEPAGCVTRFGAGRIGAIFFRLGERYTFNRTSLVREYLSAFVRELFPDPLVTVSGSRLVDVTVMRNHGKLCVNLVNTAGPHDDPRVYTFDEIPAVGPLEVAIRASRRPRSITSEPGGRALRFRYSGGRALVRIPRLEIHQILVVD